MPEDLKLSQIGSSQLPPPFRGLHSPVVRKHCQIIFACYFRKSSIVTQQLLLTGMMLTSLDKTSYTLEWKASGSELMNTVNTTIVQTDSQLNQWNATKASLICNPLIDSPLRAGFWQSLLLSWSEALTVTGKDADEQEQNTALTLKHA